MVGTGEALLNVRSKGGQLGVSDGRGKGAASVSTEQEFDFQGELQKFDKVTQRVGLSCSEHLFFQLPPLTLLAALVAARKRILT